MADDRIEIKIGRTISMGQGSFEFIRADIGLSIDVEPNDDIEEAYDEVFSLVKEKLDQYADQLEEEYMKK